MYNINNIDTKHKIAFISTKLDKNGIMLPVSLSEEENVFYVENKNVNILFFFFKVSDTEILKEIESNMKIIDMPNSESFLTTNIDINLIEKFVEEAILMIVNETVSEGNKHINFFELKDLIKKAREAKANTFTMYSKLDKDSLK